MLQQWILFSFTTVSAKHYTYIAATYNMCVSVTEHVIQDSTTTTVKDILPTVVQVTHTLIVVDGGVGEDVVAQRKPTP